MQLSTILKALDHNLIEDVALYDVREKTALFDTVLIATIRSYPQMEACVRYLEEVTAIRGAEMGRDWTLIDLGDVIIHLFAPNDRERYGLDQILASYIMKKQD